MVADGPHIDTSTLAEWLADPRGRDALMRAVGHGSDGRPNGVIADADRVRVIENFPLRALVVFPGSGLTHHVVDAVCAAGLGGPARLGAADSGLDDLLGVAGGVIGGDRVGVEPGLGPELG
jgi:hypothetical protein